MRVDLDGAEERRGIEEAERQGVGTAALGDDADQLGAEDAGATGGGMGDVGLRIAQEAPPGIGVGLLDPVGASATPRLVAVAVHRPAIDRGTDRQRAGRLHRQRRDLDQAQRRVAGMLQGRPQDHGLAERLDAELQAQAHVRPHRRPAAIAATSDSARQRWRSPARSTTSSGTAPATATASPSPALIWSRPSARPSVSGTAPAMRCDQCAGPSRPRMRIEVTAL